MALAFQPAIREAEAEFGQRTATGCRSAWGRIPKSVTPATKSATTGTAGQQGGIVMQEFVTGGKLDLNRAVALREKAAAEQRLAQARFQVITMIRKYYFECLRPIRRCPRPNS